MSKPTDALPSGSDSGDLLLVAAGDGIAAQRLLDRWRQPLYALFERTREPSAAADAAAEVLASLFRSAGRYDPRVPFPVALYGLAARLLQKPVPTPAAAIAPQRLHDPAARTFLLRSAVASLPPGERAAFLLARVARLPFPTAAQALGVSESGLKKRLVRALEALREPLQRLLESTTEPPAAQEPSGGAAGVARPEEPS